MKELDLLNRVLLNMRYDSKKTLKENYITLLKEQSTKVGDYTVSYEKSSNQIKIGSPSGKTYFWAPSTGKWTRLDYHLSNEIYTDLDPTKNNKTIKTLNNILLKSGIGSVFYIKNTDQGNKFRSWVNQKDPNFAKSINLDLKGPYDNDYIRKAWVKYGQEYKKVSKENNQFSNVSKSTIDFLKQNGFDPTGAISDNHAYALSVIRATKNLTQLITNKITGTNWSKYSICVTQVNGNCKPGRYDNFKTFNMDMAKKVNSYDDLAKGLNPPYFMILENFYFDSGKIREDLEKTFKYDKDAFKSVLFPDGWWNWFTNYFGSDNYKTISSKIQGITYLDLPKVKSKVKVDDSTSLYDILSDGHTLLDLASIAVLLLPPPAGIVASSTIDGINALWYLQEGHPYLAALTAIGIIPGIKQTKLLTTRAKMDPKILKFVEDLTYTSKGEKLTQGKIDDIFAKHTKNLTDAEKLTFAQDLITIGKNADKSILDELYKTITKWDTYSKYDKNLLKDIFKNEKNFKILQKNKGNLDLTLKELRETLTREQKIAVCIQAGLYVTLSELLPKIVNEDVIRWVYKTGLMGFKDKVQVGENYNWKSLLETFKVANEKEDPAQYERDLALLEMAWNSGWRPIKNDSPVIVPEEFRTESYKKYLEDGGIVIPANSSLPQDDELLKSFKNTPTDTSANFEYD